MKDHISRLTREKTHAGNTRTLARQISLLSPKTLTTKAFLKRDRERDFHRLRGFSNFFNSGYQLSCSVSTTPKKNAQDLHLANPGKAMRLVVTIFPRPEPHGLGFGPIKLGPSSLLKNVN